MADLPTPMLETGIPGPRTADAAIRTHLAPSRRSPARLCRRALLAAGLAAVAVPAPQLAAQGPIVILVNNAIPDDDLDDTAAIAAAIDLASPPNAPENVTKIITLQAGRYDLSYSGLPFQLNGLKHIRFAGAGAELMVHGFNPNVPFSGRILFRLVGTTDIEFRNLSFDMARLPYTQGTVVARNLHSTGNSIDVEFDPAATDLGAQTQLSRIDTFEDVVEPTGTVTLPSGKVIGGGEPDDYTVTVLQALPPIRLQFTAVVPPPPDPPPNLHFAFGAMQPGMRVLVGHQKYAANIIQADHADGVSVSNCTAYAAPGMFLYGLHARDIAVDHLQLLARPGRVMSISADGLHLHNCTGTFSFTNSYCERMGDDAVNVHGRYLEVTSLLSATRFGVNYPDASGWGAELSPGNTVEFWTSDLRKRVSLSVVSFTPPTPGPGGTTIAGELKTSKQPLGPLGPISVGDVLESPAQAIPSTTTIDHVDVFGNLGRSFLLQSRNVTVRSCHLVRNTGPAIRVTTDNFDFEESLPPNNVLIDACTIERSNWGVLATADRGAINVNAWYGTSWPPLYPQAGVVRNVTVTNNTIRDVPFAALFCTSATDCVFDGNTLDQVATDPTWPDTTFVRVINTDGLQINNNTSTVILPPSFQRVRTTNSQNVTITGNTW